MIISKPQPQALIKSISLLIISFNQRLFSVYTLCCVLHVFWSSTGGPFFLNRLFDIRAWISNYIYGILSDVIACLRPNFNGHLAKRHGRLIALYSSCE